MRTYAKGLGPLPASMILSGLPSKRFFRSRPGARHNIDSHLETLRALGAEALMRLNCPAGDTELAPSRLTPNICHAFNKLQKLYAQRICIQLVHYSHSNGTLLGYFIRALSTARIADSLVGRKQCGQAFDVPR